MAGLGSALTRTRLMHAVGRRGTRRQMDGSSRVVIASARCPGPRAERVKRRDGLDNEGNAATQGVTIYSIDSIIVCTAFLDCLAVPPQGSIRKNAQDYSCT